MAKDSEGTRFYEMPGPRGFAIYGAGSTTMSLRADNLLISLGAFAIVVDPESVTITSFKSKMSARSWTAKTGTAALRPMKNQSTVTFRPYTETRFTIWRQQARQSL